MPPAAESVSCARGATASPTGGCRYRSPSHLVAATLSAGAAAVEGRTVTAISAAVAAGCLLVWLAVFLRMSAPINRVLTAAATECRVPTDVRRLQHRWDGVLYIRIPLHTLALAALCVALAGP